MVPWPKIELFQELSPRIITETCRSRDTRMNGFFWFFGLFLVTEFTGVMQSRSVPEKSVYRVHLRPLSCI